jgi:hypothetical protein
MQENTKVKLIPAHKKEPHLIKAGIYVRVSTARAPQLRSLSSQVSIIGVSTVFYNTENTFWSSFLQYCRINIFSN